jgi:predicted enzyme related to lactoylglutathione lyase
MAVGPLGQVHVSVNDLDAAVAFYRDVLGVPFLFAYPGMAFFQSGEVRLYLGTPESAAFASHPLLYFTVDDLDAEHARLVAAGVTCDGPPHLVHRDDSGELWMASFRDPQGNPLVLMRQRRTVIPAG